MLAGLAFPTSGAVRMGDCAVSRNMLFRTAYLTEHDMFSARTTVGDMLTFYHSQFPDFQLEKAHNLLTEMNLPAKRKIKELSKGSRGRLKIVLACREKHPSFCWMSRFQVLIRLSENRLSTVSYLILILTARSSSLPRMRSARLRRC